MKNIFINPIEYDYSKQEEQLNELLKMKREEEQYQKIINKAIKINPLIKDKLEEININNEILEKEINKQLKLNQRNTICKLDNYSLFIASRYFNNVDDHINLTFVSKRMRGNMEKFHYNPTSVDYHRVKLFPNIETLHIYKENDMFLEGGRIAMYCDWIERSYEETSIIKNENKGKRFEFKKLIWTRNDTRKIFNEI